MCAGEALMKAMDVYTNVYTKATKVLRGNARPKNKKVSKYKGLSELGLKSLSIQMSIQKLILKKQSLTGVEGTWNTNKKRRLSFRPGGERM